MRISTQQIWYLMAVLKDSLMLDSNIFSLTQKQRLGFYNTITQQQDNVIREHEDGEGVPNRKEDSGSKDSGVDPV